MNTLMMGNNAMIKDDLMTLRRSSNVTESVPVPSSEHVAEIVGRQGCKIKALRAKTNTYIKTPVRDEEPVFVVTGRKEDVIAAKAEIMSAAEHFSQIRAARRPGGVGPGSPTVPGQVKLNVPVPYRVVGLLVGSKGATIKKIQQKTSTYIVTPSREKAPMFEVTGQEENVYQARALMYYHIYERTGQLCDPKSMGDVGQQQQNFNTDFLHDQKLQMAQMNTNYGADSLYEDPMSALAALNPFNGAFTNQTKANDFNLQNALKTMSLSRSLVNSMPDSLQLPPHSLKQAPVDEGICLSPPMTSTCFWSTDDGKGTGVMAGMQNYNTSKACPLQKRANSLNSFSLSQQQSAPQTTAVTTMSTNSLLADKFLSTGYTTLPSTLPCISTQNQSRINLPELGNQSRASNVATLSSSDSSFAYSSLSALTSALVPLSGGSGGGGGACSATDSVAGSMVSTPDTSPMTGMPCHFIQDSSSSFPSTKKSCLLCLKNEVMSTYLPCGHNHFCTECAELVLKKAD